LRASMIALVIPGLLALHREPSDVTSGRRPATAVPMSTFKVQYAGQGLIVSKHAQIEL
jgi:hypothetical protein